MAKTNHNSKLSPFDSKESNPFAQTSASESKPSPSAPELSPSAGQGNNPIKEPGKHDYILPNPDLDPIGVHWPRQSLFVGSNHVVQWNGGGGGFAANSESVSEADLDVALGRNPIETTRGEWNDMMKDLGWFYPQNEIVEAVNSKNQTQIVGKEVAGVKGIPNFRG